MNVNVNTGTGAGYMNPWQAAMMQAMGQFMPQAQPALPQQQPTTPPMVHADMIEAESEDWARNFSLQPGQTQIFYRGDESAMYIKTMHAQGGGYDFDVYLRQPRKPAPEYMTREQVEALIRDMQEGKAEK